MIYNPWFETNGIDAVVVPMGCEVEDFPSFLRLVAHLRNFAGALITMPHKTNVIDLLDEVSPAVHACGACDAVKRAADGKLIGDMFDGEGYSRGVLRRGRAIAGASALVIGAGGVGSAIAASLSKAGVARLGIFDTDVDRCVSVAKRIRIHFPDVAVETGSNDPAGRDIVTNATPLGMNADDLLPLDVGRLAPESFLGEVVLTKEETRFLAAARARGCATQLGTDMLFE